MTVAAVAGSRRHSARPMARQGTIAIRRGHGVGGMRVSRAAKAADRISRSAILLAGLLCGVLVFFVAVPLALSSPFPSLREETWALNRPSLHAALSVPAVIEPPTVLEPEAPAIAWSLMSMPPTVVAARFVPAETVDAKSIGSIPKSNIAAAPAVIVNPAPARHIDAMAEVDEYLWAVYQRAPSKKDGAGDFTWKDPAAAKRMGMSMPTYVVGGMDRDFREQLYHAGRAMDAAGVRWAILSAFRDDYRQSIASGLKAGASNSLHGGKARTGGYGHGQAVDVTGAEGSEAAVWQWIDRHGAKYGLYRPMPGADPAHVQSRGDWHRMAGAMREARLASTNDARARPTKTATAAW
jgi:hypothetical protein